MNLVLKHSVDQPALPAVADAPEDAGELGSVRVPHVTIHVFHESDDLASVWRLAERDRRLASATTALRPGGLPAAVKVYAQERSPDLIIVESAADPDTLLYQIDALAELCHADTRLIVVGRRNDIQLYRRLLDIGVSNYLVAPVGVATIVSAIAGVYFEPGVQKLGRVTAVLGAKGGVGASTVAESLALELSRRRASDVLLIDFDIAFGTAGLDLDVDPNQGLTELLREPDRIDAEMLDRLTVRRGEHLALLGANASLERGCEIDEEAVDRVIQVAQGHVRQVVIDLPHLWAGWVERALVVADEVVIVSSPELASLRNAVALIGRIKQLRPNDPAPRLVLNQVGVPRRQEITARDIAQVLEIEPAVSIPFDARSFSRATAKGKTAAEVARRGPLAKALTRLAATVDPEEAAQGRRRRGWLLGRKRGPAG